MELIFSAASPYARKARILIEELGLQNQIKQTEAHPLQNAEKVRANNPLGLVPVFVKADGDFIPDSPLILDYILEQSTDTPLEGPNDYWEDRRLHALSDGIMDLALRRTQENLRPDAQQSSEWKTRWASNILNTIRHLDTHADLEAPFHLGQIALITALDYISFRHPDLNWQKDAPRLANWVQMISKRPSLIKTHPEQG